jgi:hypothetical protein
MGEKTYAMMSFEEMQKSIEAHDRQPDTIVALLATSADRVNALSVIAESHERRRGES